MIRKFFRTLAGISAICATALFITAYVVSVSLPDKYMITEGEEFTIRSRVEVNAKNCISQRGVARQAASQAGNTYQSQLSLFGMMPLKTVTVQVVEKQMVAACGSPFGIKMFTEGVMVVGLTDLDTATGSINPAKDAGVHIGDVLLRINGVDVQTNEQVAELMAQSGGKPLQMDLRRKNEALTVTLTPCKSTASDSYRAGMWVRDSSAGIGTMTFYDPTTGVFGGLGHAVCDVDTGEILPLMSGEAVQVEITGVVRGESGSPGELQGDFYTKGRLGKLYLNNETGVYGTLNSRMSPSYLIPIAFRQEVKAAPATILTTLDGSTPQEYEIMIEKVNFADHTPTKNMVIRITDERLLEKTGGIVQGMSGSPILQDGKLVGAVTHVFVNDPTRGFGIFAENMYYSVDNVEKSANLAS